MKIWRLNKGADRRIRQGHPWVFASELAHSAKEVKPGEVVALHDFQDHFLAYGYAHPSSQICFRRLSSRAKDKDVLSKEFFVDRLKTARRWREQAGWAETSHRWCYAEADGVPGLIVDAFATGERDWMFVVQASTAGIENALPEVYEALKTFGDAAIIEAPSSKSRALEGLKISEKRVITGSPAHLEAQPIRLREGLTLKCDMLHGQKTGFFLDQQWNASLLRRFLKNHFAKGDSVRILDICAYVGQWSCHIVQELRAAGVEVEATLMDISEQALAFATANVEALGGTARTITGDALKLATDLQAGGFDVVVCDPPAFVKKRPDLPQGLQAYAKLNRDAMKAVRAGGLFVASSCSGLVKGSDWSDVLVQAGQKSGRMFKQLARGGHGPDHPVRAEFPEGEYLKCEIGRVEYPY